MKHILRHEVTRQQAHQAIQTALNVYSRKYPQYHPQITWVSDYRAHISFRVKGISLLAQVEVLPDHIEMGMDVPFVFWPIRGKALRVIEGEIRKWLERAKAGEIRE